MKWLIALAAAMIGTGLRYALGVDLPSGYALVSYLPLVLVTGMMVGLWPAMAAAGLSLLGSKLLFVDQLGGAGLPGSLVLLLLLLGCGAGIWMMYSVNALTARLAAETDRNLALASAGNAAAAEARRSEARLEAVLQELPIGIVQIDFAGRIEMANGQAARLLGRPLPDLNGQTVADMVHIADRADLAVFFEGLSRGARSRELRLRATGAGRPALLVHGGLARDTGPDGHSLLLAIERTA